MDFFEIVNHFFNRERVDVIQLERSEREVIQILGVGWGGVGAPEALPQAPAPT